MPKKQQVAKGAKRKDPRPTRKLQPIRSARNKLRKVRRHVSEHPNDRQSIDALLALEGQ